MLRSETGIAGATKNACRTGSDVPYDEVVRLLQNWQRWAATWFPDLGVQPPPWAEQFIPAKAWDPGWGDYEAAPCAGPPDIHEADAERVDKAIMQLATAHVVALKNRYLHDRKRWPSREVLDAAIRALGDIL
jgi:hypothetical protein